MVSFRMSGGMSWLECNRWKSLPEKQDARNVRLPQNKVEVVAECWARSMRYLDIYEQPGSNFVGCVSRSYRTASRVCR